jgi:quinol monooxygenase YgiN
MKGKLFVVAVTYAQPGKEAELQNALLELVSYAKTEPGFVKYDLHVSQENPGEFLFYEIWDDEKSLELHGNTDNMKAFGEKYGHLLKSTSMKKYNLL